MSPWRSFVLHMRGWFAMVLIHVALRTFDPQDPERHRFAAACLALWQH